MRRHRRDIRVLALSVLVSVLPAPLFSLKSETLGRAAVINDDAGWCWFQDERAIFLNNQLIVGSVASGFNDPSRRGNVEVSSLDLDTGETTRYVLHSNLEADDHAAPALLVLPDQRLLAIYSRHGSDRRIRRRITVRPGDISAWTPESSFRIRSLDRGATYTNLYRLESEGGRIYDFYRGRGFDPNVVVSEDRADSWRSAGRLLRGPGRPYLRYASNDLDTVHFVCTEQHPRDFDNSLYHGRLYRGLIYDSFGDEVGKLGSRPAAPEDLTRFFPGDRDHVAWPADVDLDQDGRVYVVYSVQKDGAGLPPGKGGMDHRYGYAWFDGIQWRHHEIAYAGSRIYPGEDDYTGLICLHPRSLDTVYFSANADPETGAPLLSRADGRRHYEIFKGVTKDQGETWTITAVTHDSSQDQIRPNVPIGGPEGSALVWLSGSMTTFRDYDLEMVVMHPAP